MYATEENPGFLLQVKPIGGILKDKGSNLCGFLGPASCILYIASRSYINVKDY